MYITNEMYKTSYKEIFLIIMSLPQEYIKLIPEEKIKFYYENMDNNYDYKIDYEKRIDEQNMSEVTKAILANLYRDYFVTDEERINILKDEENKLNQIEEEKRKKYNPENIFKNNIQENIKKEEEIDLPIILEEKSIMKVIIKKIKNLLHIN